MFQLNCQRFPKMFTISNTSALAIAEPPRESYGDDDSDSITGSTVSLGRSSKFS